MNNDAIRQFVRKELRAVTLGVATAIGIGGGLPAAIANPIGGAVVSGQGSISSPNAATTLINQQSNQLTLNWSSFNIASGQTVRFVQPSSSAVALNNILSQSPSQIFGELDANGRVVLINPNGILFGRSAQLNVGSLIASSLELKQYDPATGRLSFQSLSGHAGVIDNEGTITAAPGGSVALLGGTVLNNGLVVADYGTVAMGAGDVATLDFYGGGLLRLQVSGDAQSNPGGAAAAVQNSGRIQADGGQVLLTAGAAQGVFAAAVDNSGVIRAARIQNVGGVIELLGTDGAATNSGTLDASGADAASTGGTVTVTGNSVSLTAAAKVNVSGAAGGGNAYIGGGLHGADSSVPNASSTSVAAGATVDADATHTGNGGTVAVWSDGMTTAQGSFSASAGPAGGNGGMIETSGHVLNATGATVRAAAPAGDPGLWLLDPYDVAIDHGSGASISGGDNGTNTTVFDGDINAALKGTGTGDGTDVTIETSKPAATSPTATGAITFGSGVVITNADNIAHTLTLAADTSIDLTATTAPSITSGTGALNLVLTANANGEAQTASTAGVTLAGTITVNDLTVTASGPISQTGGTIKAGGNLSETAGGAISQGTGAGIQLTGTAGTNTATFTVTGGTFDVNLDGATNDFNDEATTIAASGTGAAVQNVDVVDTNATFVPLTLPGTLTSLVLSDSNAPIALTAQTLTGVGAGNNLAGGTTTLDVTAGGAITQSGALAVTGTTALNADAGTTPAAITLSNASNTFSGNVAFTGTAVTLQSAGALSSSGSASGNLSETAGGTISEGTAGIQLTGTAGTNTATFTVTGATHDVNLGNAANNFKGEATTIAATGTGAAVGNASVADTNATFVPLTLPASLTSLVLSDPNAAIGLPAATLTGVVGTNLAGGTATLAVTAGGAITQSGALAVTGTTTLNADAGTANGAITLTNIGNAFSGSITATGGAVSLANTLSTTLAGADTASNLTLDSGGAVTFGTASTDSTILSGALVVQGLSGGAAGGTVSQVGKLSVGTTSNIDAGTNAITLGNSANTFSGNVSFNGAAVTLAADANGLSSSGIASGNLSETTAGDIAEGSAGIQLTGTAGTNTATFTVSGTTHNVNLSSAANNFNDEATTITASGTGAAVQNVDVVDTNATFVPLTLPATLESLVLSDANAPIALAAQTLTGVGAGNNLAGGTTTLDVTAGGAITQSGAVSVTGTTALNAGTGAITLNNAANAFSGNVGFAGGAVTLASSGALSTSGTASGNLSETAGGTISEGAAGIQLGGTAGTNTATFTVTGGTHDVNLGNSANNFKGEATTITAAGGGAVGNVSVADTNAAFVPLTLSATTLTSLVLSDHNAPITLGPAVLTGVGAGTNLAGGTTTLDVTAGGAITQSGAVAVTGTTALNAGGGAIALNNPGNAFSGNVAFTGGAVTLQSAGALSSSGTASGNLSETAGGTISEGAAGIRLTGAAGADTATFTVTGGTQDVNLGSAANNFNDDPTTIMASGGAVGNVAVADTNATFVPLTLSGTLTSLVLSDPNAPITLAPATLTGVGAGTNLAGGTTTLAVTAGGPITQSGAVVVGGTSALIASGGTGDITLSNAANVFNGGITVRGNNVAVANTAGTTIAGASTAGSLTLDAGAAVTFGAVSTDSTTVTNGLIVQGVGGSGPAGGAVGQVGKLVVGGTTSIDAGANDITLSNSANALTGAVTFTGGAVTLANADATTLAGADSAGSLTLDAGGAVTFGAVSTDSTTVANGLIVRGVGGSGAAGGAVGQVGTLAVGGTSNINAGGNAITLGNPANNFGGNVGFAGSTVTLASVGPLSSSGSASGNLDETAGGTIGEGAAGIQLTGAAGTNTATFTVAGVTADVNLGGAANNFNGEATTIAASGAGGIIGNISVADSNATFVPLTLPATTLTSLVLSDPHAPITLAAETLTGVGAGTNLAGGTTTLDVTAGGAITQSGALVVDGTSALNTTGNITLSNAANTFNGGIALGGNDVTVTNTIATTVAGANTTGSLTLDSGGAVSQAGALVVAGTTSVNAGTNDITLANSSNALSGAVTMTGGAVSLANADATTLAGATSVSSLTLAAGGAVSETGTLSVATTTSVNAGTNDITLAQANTFGGNVAFSGHNVSLATGTGDLMSSGSASGNLTETGAGAITQGGALNVTGKSTLTANGGTGDITLANAGNTFAGPVTLSGAAVTLANAGAMTLAGASKAASLTLDAGGAVTFGAASTDSTTVTNNLIVQGVSGSGAAGGAVSEVGTLNVGGTTSIDAGGNDINLNQVNTFGGGVTFAGRNVVLTAGTGGLTSSGTASGTLTEIAKGSSSDLNIGSLSAGGNTLLIAGDSILGTSALATVTANNVEVRYGLENSNGQLGSTTAGQQVGFVAAGSPSVQLTLWLPAPGTQFLSTALRQTASDLTITRHPFAAGEQQILYSAPFGVSPGQVTGTLAAIQSTLQGTATQSAGVALGAATQGTQSVLIIDWGSYNPNVSLFGTLNPAVCLPADQRDEGVGSGSGCAAASASVLKTPTPALVAMVPTQEGWKPMQLYYLAR